MSYYQFEEFKKACSYEPENVKPINNVLKDANTIFNLHTKKQLLDFISNDGLEDLQFVNSKNWEDNPNKENPVKVDAYKFKTMSMLGYIAFMYNKLTKKWLIKSFHLSNDRDTSLMNGLKKAGLMKNGEKNEK